MSIIIKNPKTKEYFVYTKGADNVLFPILEKNQVHEEITLKHLEEFASNGLRTLVICKKKISEEFLIDWKKKFNEYKTKYPINSLEFAKRKTEGEEDILDENISKEYKEKIEFEDHITLIESNLKLIGCTAIEDKLQDEVNETISALHQADIKIWVLTGDKQETAINIGYACNLINNSMIVIIVEGKTIENIQNAIEKNYKEIFDGDLHKKKKFCLVVDGEVLTKILKEKKIHNTFLKLSLLCHTVICCRASPKQKGEVVQLVKKNNASSRCLAVGLIFIF
jgi:phospholipid-transporting ATPase